MDAKFCLRCASPLEDVTEEGRTRKVCGKKCGYVFYGNPTPVVAAIVEHDGCVILVRNVGWPESWFGLVTGFLEAEEEPAAGALREVKEELGLDATLESLVGVYAFALRNEVILAYHVRASGEIVKGAELAAFKRVPIAELRPWPFATGVAVKDWLARRAK